VLTGAGGTFCAGADLHAMTDDPVRRNRLERSEHGPMGPTRWAPSKPVIAAIEGHAVAGGLELALWCDLRVAGRSAVLGVFCRRWGVPLIDGGTVRLPRLVGLGVALDLILTGRPSRPRRRSRLGLVTRVVPTAARRGGGRARPAAGALPQTHAARGPRLGACELRPPAARRPARTSTTGAGGHRGRRADEGVARFQAGEGRHGAGTTAAD
jgi:enoyl-CoA hydratase